MPIPGAFWQTYSPLDAVLDQLGSIRQALRTVESLITSGGVAGSFSVTLEVLGKLKGDTAFRNGFTMWLSTDTGRTQFENMRSDANTKYTIEIGKVGDPKTGQDANAETVPSYFERNSSSPRGELDYKYVRIVLNYDHMVSNHSHAYNFAVTLGHEGFHAEDTGSGKYTLEGAERHRRLLDESGGDSAYSKMRRYYEELEHIKGVF